MRLGRHLLLGFLVGLAACGGDPTCVDEDFDGFGEHCVLGPDCDDQNAGRTDDCDIVPPPDCDADPFSVGCPCLGGLAGCYGADRATLAFGTCREGTTACRGGRWGVCEGLVRPTFETCEGTDQDCDGRVDEGVRSPCGGCTPGCIGGVWGEGEAPFEAIGDLALTERGWLTLRREERTTGEVWVANTAESTLSRIDAAAAEEVGRYFTGGAEPSRVAVDFLGDVWVANREFDGVSRIRKIASDPSRCIDRDASLSIETSDSPVPLLDDECVLLTEVVGEVGDIARALAVDGALGPDGGGGGDLWVGLHDGERILHVDGRTGQVLDTIETPGFQPYAAVFDAWGTLWMISRDGLLLSLDRFERPFVPVVREVPLACFLLYGLDVDAEGRVVTSGFSCDRVNLYDPVEDRWLTRTSPPSPRGVVVVNGDGGSSAWVAHTDGRISRVLLDPFASIETFDLTALDEVPTESIGVAEALGDIWVVSSRGADPAFGVATRVDGQTGEVSAQVPLGASPHSQGDMSGAKREAAFVPEATTQHVFDGCADGETTWVQLHVEADVSPGAAVEVAARHAADRSALTAQPFVAVGQLRDDRSPFPLDFPPRGVVEVQLTLRTEARDGAPRVRRVGLEWSCPGPD